MNDDSSYKKQSRKSERGARDKAEGKKKERKVNGKLWASSQPGYSLLTRKNKIKVLRVLDTT
jgi:hypothetical protein